MHCMLRKTTTKPNYNHLKNLHRLKSSRPGDQRRTSSFVLSPLARMPNWGLGRLCQPRGPNRCPGSTGWSLSKQLVDQWEKSISTVVLPQVPDLFCQIVDCHPVNVFRSFQHACISTGLLGSWRVQTFKLMYLPES